MIYLFSNHSPLASEEAMYAHADLAFEHAKVIQAGGIEEAREYARQWLDHYRPTYWLHWNGSEGNAVIARQKVNEFAASVFSCARNIVARGEAHYVTKNSYGHNILMTATLIADASAGPIGYQPMRHMA